MEQSDIPVFIGIGNDNQPVTTKITSINFARLFINVIGIITTKCHPDHRKELVRWKIMPLRCWVSRFFRDALRSE